MSSSTFTGNDLETIEYMSYNAPVVALYCASHSNILAEDHWSTMTLRSLSPHVVHCNFSIIETPSRANKIVLMGELICHGKRLLCTGDTAEDGYKLVILADILYEKAR